MTSLIDRIKATLQGTSHNKAHDHKSSHAQGQDGRDAAATPMTAAHEHPEGAENGNVHSMKPLARKLPPPPLPGIVDARPLVPCALPSYTLRKHKTWFARPAATARHAFITEPS